MEFDNLKDLRERNVISEKCYITRIVDFAKIFLEKNMKLEVQKIAEKGCYGGKIIAREEGSSINLAVKVVIAEKCPKQDIEIWPSLKHPNIHRLLDMQYLSRVDAHIFVTEHHSYNLKGYLQSPIILENRDALAKIKGLLWGILEGLEYLHDRGYSHLALKPTNILISSGDKAVISNFSVLDTAKSVPNSSKVALNYGPPEMHFQNDGNLDLYGSLYDIWSVGILALNIFTKGYMQKKIPEDADWQAQVYPTLRKVLEMCKFSRCIKKAFPAATLNSESKKLMINFVMTCLRILPADRPSPRMLLRHAYFNPDGGFITVYKQPWNKKRRLQADSWIEMLNCPPASSNECATTEILKKSNENSTKYSKENSENDNILETQDTKLAKSLKDKQKSAKDTIQNPKRLLNGQNNCKETKDSNSATEELMKYPTEKESNNCAEINHRVLNTKKFDIFRFFNKCFTGETTKESKVLPSIRKKNELVNESRISDNILESSDSKQIESSKDNVKKSAKEASENQQNGQNHNHLTNSQNESKGIKKSSSITEESEVCSTSNKSDNCLQISDINARKIDILRNKEITLDSGLETSTQEKVNDSAENLSVEESNICPTSNKSNNFDQIPDVSTKKTEIIINCETTLDINVIPSSQKETDEKFDIVGDHKSKLELESFDDYSIKTRMSFMQPEFNDTEDALMLPEKEHSFFWKQKGPLSESKTKMDSGDNSFLKILIDEDHSRCMTNFTSLRTIKEEEHNETRCNEEEIHAKQCHKEAEETDLKVFHGVECSSRSRRAVENASTENKSNFINESDRENHTFSPMKSQLTNLTTKDNKSRMCIFENELNSLQVKQSISVSSYEVQSLFCDPSEQTGDNLNAEFTARIKRDRFDTSSLSSSENQEESVTEALNLAFWEPESNVELGQFDVRVHGDVVSTSLEQKQNKGGNCGGDTASNA